MAAAAWGYPRAESRAAPAAEGSLAELQEDSFDDICDQIRLLRASVLPRGAAAAAAVAGARAGAAAADAAAPTPWPPPARARPRPPPAAPHLAAPATWTGGSVGAWPQDSAPAPPPAWGPGGAPGEPVAASPRLRQPASPWAPAGSSPRSPRKAFKFTLWEERLLARCFQEWSYHCRAVAATSPSSGGPLVTEADWSRAEEFTLCVEEPPGATRDAACGELLAGLLGAWRRAAAEHRARELSLSVQVINGQVLRSLRSGMARWRQSSELVEQERRTAARGRRARQARQCRALRRWAEGVHGQRELDRREQERRLACSERARRAALAWWAASSQARGGRRQQLLVKRLQTDRAAKLSVVRRLREHAASSRAVARQERGARGRLRQAAQRRVLRQWRALRARHGRQQDLLELLCARAGPRALAPAFQAWLSDVRREHRRQAALQRARIVTALCLKGRVFYGWSAGVGALRSAAGRLRALAATAFAGFTAVVLARWKQEVQWRVRLREQFRERRSEHDLAILAKFFGLLRERVSAQRALVGRAASLGLLSGKAYAAHALQQWRLAAARERSDRQGLEEARRAGERAALLRHLAAWRQQAADERTQRSHSELAEGQHSRRAALSAFLCWRRAWHNASVERRLSARAAKHRPRFLGGAALLAWSRYLAARRDKRHSREVAKCRAAAGGARAASALGRWARAWAAAVQGREARRAQARAVASRWFMWREVTRIRALKAERARLALGRLRGAGAARRWRGLRDARALCQRSTERSLARWAVGLWQLVLSQTRAAHRAKVEQGQQIGCQFALRRTFVQWWQRVAWISDLRRRFTIFREALAPVVRWRLRGQQLLALRELRAWASQCRRADDARLLHECFQGWVAHCCQRLHKTSVDLLCRRYRETHSMGRAFRGWAARCARARGLAQGVLRWAASVATDRVLASLCAWRRVAVRRRGLRALTATVLVRRRSRKLAMWRCTLVRQLAIRGTLAHKERELRRAWLLLWRRCAAALSARRRREVAQALLVQLSRQRSWIDRWVEARSRQRMHSVAVNWDVTGRDLLRLAIMAWSGTMGLYERGRRAADAVAQRRMRRHARGWASLWRAATARPWTSGRLALSAWSASHLQAVEERRQQAWMVRLVLFASVARVARIQTGCARRADHAASWRRVRLGLLRGHWAHRCAELRVADHGPRARLADREREAVEERGRARRRRDALGRWRDSWLAQRARIFRGCRPHLRGTPQAQQALQAWSQHASRQLRNRAAAASVVQLCAEVRLSHFLERWVDAYEYEASAFYAGQILRKWWLSRIVVNWQRVCAFQKRFSAHVSDVCTLRNTKLQQRVLGHWTERIQRHRLIAAVWLERRQLWSSALLRAWRGEARRLRSLRDAVRRLRTEARRCRGRRAAVLMQVRGAAGLQRTCFGALSRWARESAALRARCGDLERLVERGRQGRRLCAWMANTRAVARCLEAQATALRAWAAETRRQASAKDQLQSLASRRQACGLLAATAAWRAWVRRARRAAAAEVAVRERAAAWQRGRCACEWLALAQDLRHRRALLVGHRVRWRPHHLWSRFAAWALAARCVRRARATQADSLALCLRVWRVRAATASGGRRRGQAALRSFGEHLAAPVARAWLARQRRRVAARRLVRVLDREPEWVDDEEWFYHAASDQGLAAMFARFAHAFDQQRPADAAAARTLAADEGAFESLVSLIWERQQASVALGRLKGYPQPWVLGSWPREFLPMLAPSSPYYLQAELRLAVMVSQLETAQAPGHALRALRQGCAPGAGDGSAPSQSQRLLMWRAAADMMVVHHPGWLSREQSPDTSFSFHHEGDSAGGPCGGPEDVTALLLGMPAAEARAAGALAARAPAAVHGGLPGPGWHAGRGGRGAAPLGARPAGAASCPANCGGGTPRFGEAPPWASSPPLPPRGPAAAAAPRLQPGRAPFAAEPVAGAWRFQPLVPAPPLGAVAVPVETLSAWGPQSAGAAALRAAG